jgi:hypothetical protein
MEKICEKCENNYKTYIKTQKYCSRQCALAVIKKEKIKRTCEYSGCTNTFEIYKESKTKRVQRFCSNKCQNYWQRYSQLGENNGMYGKENKWGNHSEEKRQEIREKVKKSWENPKRLEKHLKFIERHRLPDGSLDYHNDLFREKISKSNIERMLNNPRYGAYKNCKRGWYLSSKTNDEEWYHSSWEEIKMKELDEDENVKFWTKKHGYVIEYFDGNFIKRYLPDFLIHGEKKMVLEVKGYVSCERLFKIKSETALKFFHNLDIDYEIDFMKNEERYVDLINWFNKKKKEYYGEN